MEETMSVYDSEAFAERVNFAANYIRRGCNTTRRFDTCFEMYDGDCVATALVRRAQADPAGKLAANLFRYISKDRALESARKLAHVSTRDLKHEAAEMRRKDREEFDRWLAEQDYKKAS